MASTSDTKYEGLALDTKEEEKDEKDTTISTRLKNFVDSDYDPQEEKLLDRKFNSLWQPSWMGQSRPWRVTTRFVILGIAVALLWLTSLKLATTIAGLYVASPNYQDVVKSWEFTIQLTQGEKANSEACVERQIAQCYVVLNQTFDVLLANYQRESQQNQLALTIESGHTTLCSNSWDQTLYATSQYLAQQLQHPSIYVTPNDSDTTGASCTSLNITNLKNILGDVSQQKSEVYVNNAQYARESQGVLGSAAASMKNRSDYDSWYIKQKFGFLTDWSLGLNGISAPNIGNIDLAFDIENPVNELIGCTTLSDSGCNFSPDVNAKALYDKMRVDVNAQMVSFADLARFNYNSAITLSYKARQYVASVTSLFNVLSQFTAPILTITGIDLIASWPAPNLLAGFSLSSLPTSLPSVPRPDLQFAPLTPAFQRFDAQMDQVGKNIHDAGQRWADDINQSLGDVSNPFSDYDPPPLTVNTSSWDVTTNSFLDKSKKSLSAFDITPNTTINFNATQELSKVKLPDRFSLLSSYKVMAAPFEGSISLYNFFGNLSSILSLFIVGDIIYRLWGTLRFVKQYSRMSELGLPVIDIREFSAAKASANPTLQAYQLCTHPFVVLFVLGIIGIVIIGALTAIYIPLYESYQDGCRKSNNGTLVTHNTYAFAYNWAASDANENTARGLTAYDQKRTSYCAQYAQQSQKQQQTAEDQMTSLRTTYDDKAEDLALYQKCVDPSTLANDSVWLNLTNNTYGNPYSNGTLLTRLYCSVPGQYGSEGLGDGVFNCSGLPPCLLSCSGPDQAALSAATYESGCTSEWMFHAGLYRFLLALLVFICLNMSRTLVVMAIIRLAWRSLTAKGFEFTGTCSKLGTVQGLEARLQTAVDKEVRSYERGALAMLILAVLVHIPYIVILTQFGNVQGQD